jgi:hypothetical protein
MSTKSNSIKISHFCSSIETKEKRFTCPPKSAAMLLCPKASPEISII